MKNSMTQVALLDRYEHQVQGIGETEQAALDEAKEYGIAGLPQTVEAVHEKDGSGDPRFSFVPVTAAEARRLDEAPTWNFGTFATR